MGGGGEGNYMAAEALTTWRCRWEGRDVWGGERETLFTLSSPLILTPQILEAYEKTLDSEVLPSEAYEHGEMLMYKAQV